MKWIHVARELGFDEAAELRVETLQPMEMVRAMCAQDKCRVYGRNWTCPPACGSLEACAQRMRRYSKGILLQSVGSMTKTIDSRAIRATEERHLQQFEEFCARIRAEHPDALCLGSGGCRVCAKCAHPDPCRFPERANSSMEAYGLFVTQVCRDNGVPYHHGERTITYTACVLFN